MSTCFAYNPIMEKRRSEDRSLSLWVGHAAVDTRRRRQVPTEMLDEELASDAVCEEGPQLSVAKADVEVVL
eukprot:CAMPEP_0175808624 /NCGR_PEP_ID=MMETSP0107_2-20121207/2357_1 /TAXON_ID=195067 ORGANISM="Goniomonas pacifica, Strain CCMP1869" /NCGR_SAMPLE_ID=MMETSP0107_2 /ASSEMBLY_ACC=CAM_ASM_000203 /LENGTH=70 /DNA_ID=CAMNT_0017120261 /DNA_START=972 /DNA_END=1184 /DNA_ORIENTATION=+